MTALTHFPNPTPQTLGIKKQLVTYTRQDGVPLSFTLYLPPDYKEGTRLPALLWAYPREFTTRTRPAKSRVMPPAHSTSSAIINCSCYTGMR